MTAERGGQVTPGSPDGLRDALEAATAQNGPMVLAVLCRKCDRRRVATVRRTAFGLLYESDRPDASLLEAHLALRARESGRAYRRDLDPILDLMLASGMDPAESVDGGSQRIRALVDRMAVDAALPVLCNRHPDLSLSVAELREAVATRRNAVVV